LKPIKSMLLTMGKEAFDDNRYMFEIKWDGWRILFHKQGDRIEAYTRHVASKGPISFLFFAVVNLK
jgi:bifunctional non-homologous end joining protein LigD